jgi:hypothetical protein
MNITDLKNIFVSAVTYTSNTINTFLSGKDYEFPSTGNNIYPLAYLEEDYSITINEVNERPTQELWTIAFLVLDHKLDSETKTVKDNVRDNMLLESKRLVAFIRKFYKVTNVSYLSLLDFESDNLQGWRVELTITFANSEPICNIYE